MNDQATLDFLHDKLGSDAETARSLGVSAQAVWNWRNRGISAAKRSAVWVLVNDHGGNLGREWLTIESAQQPGQAA